MARLLPGVSAFQSEPEKQRYANLKTTGDDRMTQTEPMRIKLIRTPGKFERGFRRAYATSWG